MSTGAGEYDIAKSAEIPAPYLRRFMLRGVSKRSGVMSVSNELRTSVLFLRINLHEPDPECKLCHVPNEARPHPVRVAVSNSFGFGGSNTCLVLKAA